MFIARGAWAQEFRIISLAPNTTEMLFALNLGDFIVGVDEYSDYPEEAKRIQRIGTFDTPNIEKIIILKPDYILMTIDVTSDKKEYLEGLGAKILKISPKTVSELCDDIGMLGNIFHKERQAELIVRDINNRLNALSKDIERKRPKVFVQLFSDPLITVSSFIGDAVRLAGGDNIAWDIKDDAALFSIEELIYRNPDVIIVVGFSDNLEFPDSISAVRTNRIHKVLDADILLRPGPRIIDAIEEMNRIFYEKS